MNWISVKDDGLPMTKLDGYSYRYPVKVKGIGGWCIGRYHISASLQEWRVEGFHGDWEVTHWFNLPAPPEE
jgi:hypothetical protein